MKVYVVHYTHKHGSDICVCKTEQSANAVAVNWAAQEVEEDWDPEDQSKFRRLSDPVEKLDLFHNVEANTSYGSVINVLARELVE